VIWRHGVLELTKRRATPPSASPDPCRLMSRLRTSRLRHLNHKSLYGSAPLSYIPSSFIFA
jgi:hypothetical protein